MRARIDLNADMGESFGRWRLGNDEALMPELTSANIACGFHAGDPSVIRRTVALALEHGVGIGAHVGLPDLLGFGRRRMAVSTAEVHDCVLYQAGALTAFAEAAGGQLQHVKPHGALYLMAQEDPDLAHAVARAVGALDDGVVLLMAGEIAAEAAEAARVPFVPEGYVDIDYAADGSLVTDRVGQARDPASTAEKAVRLVTEGKVSTLDGTDLELEARSICIHGDAPNAPEIARAVRRALETAGVELAPLAGLGSVEARTS